MKLVEILLNTQFSNWKEAHTLFQKASWMKIIKEHKTGGKMEEARTSGLEPRSLHLEQIILTVTEAGKPNGYRLPTVLKNCSYKRTLT